MPSCHRVVAWVVADDAGIEWFVCGPHSRPSPTARWTSKIALAAWLHAHQLPIPDPPLKCPTVTDAVDEDDGNGMEK